MNSTVTKREFHENFKIRFNIKICNIYLKGVTNQIKVMYVIIKVCLSVVILRQVIKNIAPNISNSRQYLIQ